MKQYIYRYYFPIFELVYIYILQRDKIKIIRTTLQRPFYTFSNGGTNANTLLPSLLATFAFNLHGYINNFPERSREIITFLRLYPVRTRNEEQGRGCTTRSTLFHPLQRHGPIHEIKRRDIIKRPRVTISFSSLENHRFQFSRAQKLRTVGRILPRNRVPPLVPVTPRRAQ